jgi:acyl-coenzyme A synthetase/AMP-(fatty) acid ligase
LFTSIAFYLTVTSLFLPLIRGQTLRIFPREAALDSILCAYFDAAAALDSIKLTPAHISLLPSLGLFKTKVKVAIVGGEQLLLDHVRSLWRINPQMRIYNEYGPTETTVGCVVKEILPDEDRILIGQPIDNTRVYALDKDLQPLPIGVPGQLYIGGKGLARDYLNRPELTSERFIPDQFSTQARARLYRSGDLARWLPSGDLECLGRADRQTQIRGLRIELGEVEAMLSEHPLARQAIVLAVEQNSGSKHLIAYVGSAHVPSRTELRQFLCDKLPEYMVPTDFVILDRLPVTVNGQNRSRRPASTKLREHRDDRVESATAYGTGEGVGGYLGQFAGTVADRDPRQFLPSRRGLDSWHSGCRPGQSGRVASHAQTTPAPSYDCWFGGSGGKN